MTNKLSLLSVLILGALAALPGSAQAAKVNANISFESADYGSDYSYAGPRLELNLNPDGSNWYFDIGYRNREHDTKQLYTRVELQASYRYRFDSGWIQPSFKHQIDTTNYESGSRTINTLNLTETKYHLNLDDKWALWGELSVGLMAHEDKSATTERHADYFTWELEPGVHYYVTPKHRVSVTYYNTGKLSDKGETWGLSDDSSMQQVRLYYTWNTPWGITFSPYFRQSLGYGSTSSWYDSAYYDETETENTVTRYALRFDYPLSAILKAQVEYYREETAYKEGKSMGKDDVTMDYIRAGLSITF